MTTPFAKVPYVGTKRPEKYLKPVNNNKYNLFKDLFVSPTLVNIHCVYIDHLPTFFAGNTWMSFLLMVQHSRLVTKSLTTLITRNYMSVSNMFFYRALSGKSAIFTDNGQMLQSTVFLQEPLRTEHLLAIGTVMHCLSMPC